MEAWNTCWSSYRFISCALNRFGKIGVIIGFLLGNAILTYWVRGESTMIIYFREIFIASIGLLLVPSKIKIELEDLFGRDKLLDSIADRRLDGTNDEISEKLNAISKMFSELVPNTDLIATKENMTQDFLDNFQTSLLSVHLGLIDHKNPQYLLLNTYLLYRY